MQINHNISAVIANNQLRKSENKMSLSIERLSSGLKINRAADDPSGMAISQKMKTQIRGLNRANDNANDGISVLQTAEGGLTEITSMLQRMRELAVQSANGVHTAEDRQAIQDEIDALMEEVNRISEDTQFNNIGLLDGTIDKKGYSNMDGVSVITFSSVVEPDEYEIRVSKAAKKAELTGSIGFGKVSADQAGALLVNGETVQIEEGDKPDDVYRKIRDVAELSGVKVSKVGTDTIKFESEGYGSSQQVELKWENQSLGALFGFSTSAGNEGNAASTSSSYTVTGSNTEISLGKGLRDAIYTSDGSKVMISNSGGFKIEIDVDPKEVILDQTISLDIMNIGAMVVQVGANEGEKVELKIEAVNSYTLGLDNLNLKSQRSSENGIALLDDAISRLTSVRSAIGAYQNRLEHTISNVEVATLNMESSLSRIEDVDMAEEMTKYTAATVLEQAGTSVLAQANQMPETVLQLLN